MRIDFTRYAPPGINAKSERNVFLGGVAGALLFSCFYFVRLQDALAALYHIDGKSQVLIPGVIMKDFAELIDNCFLGFFMMALCFLILIGYHYAYHYRYSKSIYLMRRLPNRWELHRRCLAIPVMAAVSYMLIAFMVLVIYFAIYMAKTPEVCLTPNQWQKIWSV